MPKLTQPGITGTRQDIADSVLLFKAEETPVLSMLDKEGPQKQEIHQYQDARRRAVNKRGSKDATDVTNFNQSEDRNILEVNAHWIQEPYFVGKKAHTFTDVAGRKNLLANEILNKTVMLKTAMDEIICDDTDQRDEGLLGSETRGLGSWLSSTAQGVRAVPATSRTPADSIFAGAFADLTEESFKAVLKSLWQQCRTKKRYHGFFGEDLKSKVSDWTIYNPTVTGQTIVRTFQKNESHKLEAIVNIIESDFGTIELHTSPNLAIDRDSNNDTRTDAMKRRGYILDMQDGVKLKMTQQIQRMALADGGGGPRGVLDTIFSLKCFPKLNAKIAPTS